ncbi:MAG: hypothetical protein HYR63_24850 [Proteobacteria bacterium]|nr:hypothetical protein [Pseudomonadota bacterium]
MGRSHTDEKQLRGAWLTAPNSAVIALEFAQGAWSRQAGGAEKWAFRSLACDPHCVDALTLSGVIQASTGATERARRSLQRVAALNPALPTAWRNLSTWALQCGIGGAAIAFQRRVDCLVYGDLEAKLDLILVETLVGQVERAAQRLALIYRTPGVCEAVVEIVGTALEKGRGLQAAILAEAVVEHFPSSADATRMLHLARAGVARTGQDVQAIARRWSGGSGGIYHAIDAVRRGIAPGYLLIRGYGCGFWGEVTHVANNLALAEIMGRTAVVYWGREVRYRRAKVGNAWDLFFEPISSETAQELAGLRGKIFPGHWTSATLLESRYDAAALGQQGNRAGINGLAGINRPEQIVVSDGYVDLRDALSWSAAAHPLAGRDPLAVYRQIFSKWIHLRPEHRRTVDEIGARLFEGMPTVAIHVRAPSGGKNAESLEKTDAGPAGYFPHIDLWLEETPQSKLFILTDQEEVLMRFRSRYGARVISLDRIRLSQPDKQLGDGGLPQGSDVGLDLSLDGYTLGYEVLVDAYLAASCRRFIGDGASGVSCAILNLKDWREEDVSLVRRNVFTERRAG